MQRMPFEDLTGLNLAAKAAGFVLNGQRYYIIFVVNNVLLFIV